MMLTCIVFGVTNDFHWATLTNSQTQSASCLKGTACFYNRPKTMPSSQRDSFPSPSGSSSPSSPTPTTPVSRYSSLSVPVHLVSPGCYLSALSAWYVICSLASEVSTVAVSWLFPSLSCCLQMTATNKALCIWWFLSETVIIAGDSTAV